MAKKVRPDFDIVGKLEQYKKSLARDMLRAISVFEPEETKEVPPTTVIGKTDGDEAKPAAQGGCGEKDDPNRPIKQAEAVSMLISANKGYPKDQAKTKVNKAVTKGTKKWGTLVLTVAGVREWIYQLPNHKPVKRPRNMNKDGECFYLD